MILSKTVLTLSCLFSDSLVKLILACVCCLLLDILFILFFRYDKPFFSNLNDKPDRLVTFQSHTLQHVTKWPRKRKLAYFIKETVSRNVLELKFSDPHDFTCSMIITTFIKLIFKIFLFSTMYFLV